MKNQSQQNIIATLFSQNIQKMINEDNILHKSLFTSNAVLKHQSKQSQIIFLPVYLRIKIKNIVSLQFQQLHGEVNATIIFTVFYGDLPDEIVTFLTQNIRLVLNKNTSIILKKDDVKIVYKKQDGKNKKLLTFTLRQIIPSLIQSSTFWSPYEQARFIITMNLRTLFYIYNNKQIIIKFNFMNCDDINTKFSLSQTKNFGMYTIADKKLSVQYTNISTYSRSVMAGRGEDFLDRIPNVLKNILKRHVINKKGKQRQEQQQKLRKKQIDSDICNIQSFKYAHFILPVYKRPIPSILTIYIPLILLGIINIGIFYQDTSAPGKIIINAASLLVSFIGLVSSVREMTAVGPGVNITEILVFLQAFTTMLTLCYMITYRKAETYGDEQIDKNGFVVASIVITGFVCFCSILMMFVYRFVWKKSYHYEDSNSKINTKQSGFSHHSWKNQQCDQFFQRFKNEFVYCGKAEKKKQN